MTPKPEEAASSPILTEQTEEAELSRLREELQALQQQKHNDGVSIAKLMIQRDDALALLRSEPVAKQEATGEVKRFNPCFNETDGAEMYESHRGGWVRLEDFEATLRELQRLGEPIEYGVRPETYVERGVERIKPGETAEAVRYIKSLESELQRLRDDRNRHAVNAVELMRQRDELQEEVGRLHLLEISQFERADKAESELQRVKEENAELQRDLDYYNTPVLTLPTGLVISRKSIRSALVQDFQISNECAGALLYEVEKLEAELRRREWEPAKWHLIEPDSAITDEMEVGRWMGKKWVITRAELTRPGWEFIQPNDYFTHYRLLNPPEPK